MNNLTNLLLALCLFLSVYIYVKRDVEDPNSKYLLGLPIISSALIIYVVAYLNPTTFKIGTVNKQLDSFLDGPEI